MKLNLLLCERNNFFYIILREKLKSLIKITSSKHLKKKLINKQRISTLPCLSELNAKKNPNSCLNVIFFYCRIDKKVIKKMIHINKLNELVDESISFVWCFDWILWVYSDFISIFQMEPNKNANVYCVLGCHKHYYHKKLNWWVL